jgi:hypothetical protein
VNGAMRLDVTSDLSPAGRLTRSERFKDNIPLTINNALLFLNECLEMSIAKRDNASSLVIEPLFIAKCWACGNCLILSTIMYSNRHVGMNAYGHISQTNVDKPDLQKTGK